MTEPISFKEFTKIIVQFLKRYALPISIAGVLGGIGLYFLRSKTKPFYEFELKGFSYVVTADALEFHLSGIQKLINEERFSEVFEDYGMKEGVASQIRRIEVISSRIDKVSPLGFQRVEFTATGYTYNIHGGENISNAIAAAISNSKAVQREKRAFDNKLKTLSAQTDSHYLKEYSNNSIDQLEQINESRQVESEVLFISEFKDSVIPITPVIVSNKDQRRVLGFTLAGALAGAGLCSLLCFFFDIYRD